MIFIGFDAGFKGLRSRRMKALFGADVLSTKILSGGATGCLGAFLANPVVPWNVFHERISIEFPLNPT